MMVSHCFNTIKEKAGADKAIIGKLDKVRLTFY